MHVCCEIGRRAWRWIGFKTCLPGIRAIGAGANLNLNDFNQLGGQIFCNAATFNVNGTYDFNSGTFYGADATGTLVTGNVSVGKFVLNRNSNREKTCASHCPCSCCLR